MGLINCVLTNQPQDSLKKLNNQVFFLKIFILANLLKYQQMFSFVNYLKQQENNWADS